MISISAHVPDGPSSKLRWHPSTPDTAVTQLICGAVGLDSGTNIVLKDSEGYLVPCCGQLTPGASYTVLEAPGRLAPVTRFEPQDSLTMPNVTPKTSEIQSMISSRPASELVRNTLASHPDLRTTLASLPDRQLSSIIEPILDNRMTKFERLSSHLANERTYLAWVRTAVSVAGLAVTYSSLASHHETSTYWSGCTFTWVTGLVVFIVGCRRYYKVKQILGLSKSEITQRFHRTGINYVVVMFGLFLVAMTVEYIGSVYRNIT